MKKFLLLLSLLLCSVPAIKAADIVETMASFTDAKKTWLPTTAPTTATDYTSTVTNLKWSVYKVISAKANNGIRMQFTKTAANSTDYAYMETTPGIKCNKIIINVNSAGSNGGIDIFVNGTSIAHNDVISPSNKEFEFEIPAEYQTSTTTFKIANTCKSGSTTGGNQTNITSITFKDASGAPVVTLKDNELAYSAETCEATIGGENEFPTLTNPNDLAVTYDSENPAVATVDENGNVEPLSEGTTKITATFAGDDTYKAGSVFYTLTVVDPNKPQPDATLNVEAFDITAAYKIYTYAKDGVIYKAKAYSSNGMQVNSTSTSTGVESGIASVENANNLIIKQIVVTFSSGTNSNITVSMGNEPNSVKGSEDATDYKTTGINVAESAVAITGTGSGKVYTYTPADNYKYFALKSTSTVKISSIEIYYKEKPAAPVIKDGDVEIAESIEFEGDSKVVYLDLPEGVNAYYKFEVAEEATPAEAPRRAAHTPAEGFTQYVHADGITLTDNGTLHVYTEKDGAVSETRKVAVTKTGDATAIEAIEADTTAPVEYFNLQGIRVENPENGLYIRRQGSKTTKVLVK